MGDGGGDPLRQAPVADDMAAQFRVVDAFSRIVRLGEGLSASGRLSEGAMTRAVEALTRNVQGLFARIIGLVPYLP